MRNCPMERDEALSNARGTSERPNVFRCPKCGFITAPTRFSDPAKVRRVCKWFDPAKPGFSVAEPCWCKGLGDVLAWAIGAAAPAWFAVMVGRWVDVVEEWLTGIERASHAGGGCAGCNRRRVTLNSRFPLVWLRRWICPAAVQIDERAGDAIPVCFSFPHGFGDAVQFTAVLRHLRKYRPAWRMSIYCKAGAHTLFDGLVERVGVMDRDDLGRVFREDFALVHRVRWLEAIETYGDSPSTKVERCLREEFGIAPDEELWGYAIQVGASRREKARRALAEIADVGDDGRFKVVAIHYQGNSWKEAKNLDENVARRVVETVRAAGYVPLILDWEDPYRSSILREKVRGVKCFGKNHALWGGLGTGDGGVLAALLAQVRMVVGIDSGPEHCAAAVGTETVVAWGKNHPVNYFAPSRNVVHLVRPDAGKYIFGDRERGERFFRERYRFVEVRANLRIALPDYVERALDGSHSAGGVLDSRRVCESGSHDRP